MEKKYIVRQVVDCEGNPDDPVQTNKFTFETKKEAERLFNELAKQKNTLQGTYGVVNLIETTQEGEQIIKTANQKPLPLPKTACLVFFWHINYLYYAYDIEEVRFKTSNEKTIADLPYNFNNTSKRWCIWFDNINELKDAVRLKLYPFDKIRMGMEKVIEFLRVNKDRETIDILQKLGVEVVSIKEVAERLGVTQATIRKYIRQGKLEAKKFGRVLYISKNSLKEYFK